MNNKVSVIIPAKNESCSIYDLVTQILDIGYLEVIVVNDGSTDDTAKLALDAGATVINHPYSKGNGAAIKSGARQAKGDFLVFLDADGQHNPQDIPKLLLELDKGYDLVVASRGRESQASAGRAFANGLYNKLASYVTGHKVKDLTSGFRAADAKKFKEFLYLLPNGFSYPTTSTMAFFRSGYSVKYIDILVGERHKDSKSHIHPLKDGLRFLMIIFKIGTLHSPLKIFTPVSLSVFLLGLSYYLYTYISFNRFTNMSALMFSTSLIIFMVGLVSEQINYLLYKDEKK